VTADLRPARADDAPTLAAILSDWTEGAGWLPRVHSRQDHAGFLARLVAEMEVTVAVRSGEVVGFLARRADCIHGLYLAGHARGQGIGRRLVAAAQGAMPVLTLWAHERNAPARGFYAAQGFVEVERGDGSGNDERLPEVRMEWRRG